MRRVTLLAAMGWLVSLGTAGCGDDDGMMPSDGGTDSGSGLDAGPRDAGPGVDGSVLTDAGTDAGPDFDAGPPPDAGAPYDAALDGYGFADGGAVTVTMTGWVFGFDATERDPDAGATGFDGGRPDGSAATPGGRIFGAAVILRDVTTGAELSRTRTDTRGFYSLSAPSGALVFQEVEPTGAYVGVVRAERVSMMSYEAYDIYLPLRSGAAATGIAIGVTYDRTRGVVACGFNPLTPDRGGEGVMLGAGPAHAPPAHLTPTGAIVTNILPPLCSALDGAVVATDGGVPCIALARSDQIHYLNTDLGFVTVTPISPPGGTCEIRFAPPAWLVRPDSYTIVHVDCF